MWTRRRCVSLYLCKQKCRPREVLDCFAGSDFAKDKFYVYNNKNLSQVAARELKIECTNHAKRPEFEGRRL